MVCKYSRTKEWLKYWVISYCRTRHHLTARTIHSTSGSTLCSLVFRWIVCTLLRELSTTFCFTKCKSYTKMVINLKTGSCTKIQLCRLFNESKCLSEWLTRVKWSITERKSQYTTTSNSTESINRKSRRRRKKWHRRELSKSCKVSGSTTSTTLKKHCSDFHNTSPKWAD